MCEFTAHYACKNVEMNLKSTTANGLNFRIINSLMEFWGVRLTWLDCKYLKKMKKSGKAVSSQSGSIRFETVKE